MTHVFISANTPINMDSGKTIVTTSLLYDSKGRKYPMGINPDVSPAISKSLERSLKLDKLTLILVIN